MSDALPSNAAGGAERIGQEMQILELLNRVGTAVAAELELERAVQIVTDIATELSGASFGAFFYNVVDESGESLTLYTLSGAPREAFAAFGMPRNTPIFAPTFDGLGIVRSGDITTDPRYGQNAPHHGMPKGHLPVRSYLAAPVKSRGGDVLGALFFGHPEPAVFDERAERIVGAIAVQAGIAVDKARLYRAAQNEIAQRRRIETTLREERAGFEARLDQLQQTEIAGRRAARLAEGFRDIVMRLGEGLDALAARLSPGERAALGESLASLQGTAREAAALTQRLAAIADNTP